MNNEYTRTRFCVSLCSTEQMTRLPCPLVGPGMCPELQRTAHHTGKDSTNAVILSRPGRDRLGRREESVLLFYGQTAVILIPERYTVMIPYNCLVIYYAAEQILRGRPCFAWPQFGIVVQYATAYYTLCLIATSPAFIPHWGRRPPSPAQNDSEG